jgi:hypothetical protein
MLGRVVGAVSAGYVVCRATHHVGVVRLLDRLIRPKQKSRDWVPSKFVERNHSSVVVIIVC